MDMAFSMSASKPFESIPVARKAVPSRKPVAQSSKLPASSVSSVQPTPTVEQPQAAAEITTQIVKTSQAALVLSSTHSDVGELPQHFPPSPVNPTGQGLPPGWASAYNPDGRIFYLNHITKTSSWDKPESIPKPLPPGWEGRTTPYGKVYYFHVTSQLTTWDRPFNPEPIPIPEAPCKAVHPIVLEHQLSSASTDSTFDQQPTSPLSPGIEWESTDYTSARSSRRKSTFSLSSLGSASSKTMSMIKLPPSASSNAMVKGTVKGTKSAAKLGMKGVKVTGKAIKDNRKVIGLTLKVANLVLKNTTGIDMGGLDGFLEGGGDVGEVEIEGGCEDVDLEEGDEYGEVEEQEEMIDEFSTVDCGTVDGVYVDGATIEDFGSQDMQVSEVMTEITQSTIITEETCTSSVVPIDLADAGLLGEDFIAEETTIEQVTIVEQTTCQETTIVETEMSSATGQETTTAVVSTEVDTFEVTTIDETATTEIVPNTPPPFEPSFDGPVDSIDFQTGPLVPMDSLVFAPVLAGPMMVEPPAESNGVIFAPTYV